MMRGRLADESARGEGSEDEGTLLSFDTVFCSLLPKLYRRAALLTEAGPGAEDAVHDTYLKLAARPHRLVTHAEPYAYAFATMLSVIRDTWRRDRRHVLVADPRSGQDKNGATGWDGGLERRAGELEAVRLLRQLSARQAGVVILVDLDGCTIDQAAHVLGVHRGTAARSRARGLDKLRHLLDGHAPRRNGRPASRVTAAEQRRHES